MMGIRRFAASGVLASLLLVFVGVTGVRAASPHVVDGELLGAFDVDVGGVLYDVEFVDGTCIEVFSGCDQAEDFTFSNFAGAALASQALMEQVFLDGVLGDFDLVPSLTVGCSDSDTCQVLTVFERSPTTPTVLQAVANNNAAVHIHDWWTPEPHSFSISVDTASSYPYAVFARWSAACSVVEVPTLSFWGWLFVVVLLMALPGLHARIRPAAPTDSWN